MDKDNTVFKVTAKRKIDKKWKYLSACYYFWESDERKLSANKNSKVILEYKIGQITKPKIENSAIYAFDSLSNAVAFIGRCIGWNQHMTILECEYAPIDVPKLVDGQISPTLIPVFWHVLGRVPKDNPSVIWKSDFLWLSKSGLKYDILPQAAPEGTITCAWVKPIGIAT